MSLKAYATMLVGLAAAACFSGDFVVAEVVAGGATNGEAGAPTGGEAGAPTNNCTGSVLFVVGTQPLTRGDSAILDRLRGLGFVTSIIDAGAVTNDSAKSADFVLISRSVHSPDVMASFREQAVPLFVTEYNLYSSLGMTDDVAAASGGDTLSATELLIAEPAHPLAAGLSGTVTVLEPGKGQYGWGVPGGGAVVVANLVGETQGAAIFAYERGAPMFGLVAPARRVGYFLDIQAATRLTDDGWTLFDAAVQWSADECRTH